jgi:drug/metabolite transporter (DMT)-like permease
MSHTSSAVALDSHAVQLKQQLKVNFFRKGVTVAILSGMCYGLYSSFLYVAMGKGVWADWYGDNKAGLSAFVIVYALGALGSAINDSCSAIWCLSMAAIKGKLGDFFRSIKTKPGLVMVICALFGGPIASTAYVVSLQMAGSIIIPITALCPAIGAVLGRILFKQPLNGRMIAGVFICVSASIMIGSTSMGGEAPEGRLLGCLIALIAAFGWGIEGCIAGYGTTLIDYEIGITIRQTTSGLTNLIVLVPIMSIVAGNVGIAPELIGNAVTSGPAMMFFAVSGFFALFAYSLWYKGNSMCGAPLGMACNGAYSFWGPFFCWIILGLVIKQDGWMLQPIAWAAAVVMFVGICLIAFNPLDLFRKKGGDLNVSA